MKTNALTDAQADLFARALLQVKQPSLSVLNGLGFLHALSLDQAPSGRTGPTCGRNDRSHANATVHLSEEFKVCYPCREVPVTETVTIGSLPLSPTSVAEVQMARRVSRWLSWLNQYREQHSNFALPCRRAVVQ